MIRFLGSRLGLVAGISALIVGGGMIWRWTSPNSFFQFFSELLQLDSTEYTTNFNEQKFLEIAVGASRERVRESLGNPFVEFEELCTDGTGVLKIHESANLRSLLPFKSVTPTCDRRTPLKTVWAYSIQTDQRKNFAVRQIEFDSRGLVSAKSAFYYMDI